MAVERDEIYQNEEADFNIRWRKGLLAAGFSEEEIAAGVDWSDPRLEKVDLDAEASVAELKEEGLSIYGYLEELRLSDPSQRQSQSRRLSRKSGWIGRGRRLL